MEPNHQVLAKPSRDYTKNRTDISLVFIGATIWGVLAAMALNRFDVNAGVTVTLAFITAGVTVLGGFQAIGALDFRTATLAARKKGE